MDSFDNIQMSKNMGASGTNIEINAEQIALGDEDFERAFDYNHQTQAAKTGNFLPVSTALNEKNESFSTSAEFLANKSYESPQHHTVKSRSKSRSLSRSPMR